LFVRQSPAAIDAGVFHNDVIAVANERVLLCHALAFAERERVLGELRERFPELLTIEVGAEELALEEAVRTYLFNSQLLTLPDGGMTLLCPAECIESPSVQAVLGRIVAEDNPITEVQFVDVRQSMHNGGGPACLRLRVVLTEEELAAYLAEHAERYRADGRLRFLQVFVRSGPDATERAEAILERLRSEPDQDIGPLTDPFLHPLAYPDVRERELVSVYGPEFAALLMQQPVGAWSGPVPSPFGLHLVKVDARVEGALPDLDAVRPEVRRDLMFERTEAADQAYFEGLLAKYTVTVQWPEGMEPLDLPEVAR